MSNAYRNEDLGRRWGADDSSGDGVAESLKALIAHVASQIAEVDQRHNEMLQQMRSRLESLGVETRSIRNRVPGEYVPAFDRIEEGMQLLADRIASDHVRLTGIAPGPAPMPSAELASAAAADAGHGHDDLGRDAEAGEPWSRADADALAAVYHSGNAGAPHGMPDPDDTIFSGTDGVMLGAAPAPHGEIARGWLEDRFAEIARRVEQSLAEFRPDSSFLALGRRFEAFEERMGSVLEEIATRSDVEGLRLIEAHISELAQHLEATQIQLGRLDGIESQLNAVTERLLNTESALPPATANFDAAQIEEIVSQAAERVASQLAQTSNGGSQGADFDAVAVRAAEQALMRFAADQVGGANASSGAPDDLREFVEGFVRERRAGDEQTASILDTVQQAMVRVLDRIDAIELQSQRSAVPAAPDAFGREHVRYANDTRVPADPSPLRTMGRHDMPAAAQGPSIPPASADQPFAHAPGLDREPRAGMRPTVAEGVSVNGAHGRETDVPFGSPNGVPSMYGSTPATPKSSIERLRQEFIADAQRAKLRAEAEAIELSSTVAAPTAAAGGARPAKPATATAKAEKAGKTRQPTSGSSSSKSPLAAMPIKKILVAALGLVIVFQGANLLLARRKAGEPKPAAAQTQPIAPASAQGAATGGAQGTSAAKGAPAPYDAKSSAKSSAVRPSIVNPLPEEPAAAAAELAPYGDADAPPVAQKGAGARFVVPTTPHAPVTVPETVIENLNYAGDLRSDRADEGIAMADDTATDGVPVGIALQTSARPPTPYDLARLQQRQQMANLSSKLGAAAANATPAALLPERLVSPGAGANGNVAAALAERTSQARSALDLPPATVGPLSLRLAAAKGDPSAEFEVGSRLAEGKGTDQSFKEAVKWYTRSANQGFAQAQYRLGTLYERGLGVKADPARARVWYSRAAEQGNVKAMHNLAVLNAGSRASAPDYAAAAHWFGEAAIRGLSDSQFNLAVLYDSGLGVSKDASLAYLWFSLAARSGDKEAVRRRDAVKAELAPAEATAVDARVAAWLPRTPDVLANDARVAGEAWKSRENADGGSSG